MHVTVCLYQLPGAVAISPSPGAPSIPGLWSLRSGCCVTFIVPTIGLQAQQWDLCSPFCLPKNELAALGSAWPTGEQNRTAYTGGWGGDFFPGTPM